MERLPQIGLLLVLDPPVAAGELKPLPMQEGGERFGQMYLVFADPENPGKAAARLAEILKEDVGKICQEGAPP